ncbi:hypothetical protein MEX01_45720 [Methylorubrum extorquens]|uniref:hypothetical protein n=1 Tax=Methylorubrum extorquens TaxID=408 RepID=UPI00116D4DA3|nr:hypothetical protein [Methylorubrum extorquens]GEL43981.1 hypothetical protein MEX01_45720 [Methylorubrum extorquens]
MAHDIINRVARIIAPEDFAAVNQIRAGLHGGTEAVRERTIAQLVAGPQQDAKEKALEILAALRSIEGTERLPRLRSGEWSRKNIEAFVNDVVGKPVGKA